MAPSDGTPVPGITVVVVNWNGRDILRPCLDSLQAQATARPFEIVVVENGSTDGSAEMLAAEYPTVRVVETGANLGFAGGANAGIAAASGDTIVLLNNDAEAEPGFVDNLDRVLGEDPKVGAVTGRILLANRYRRGPGPGALTSIDGDVWHVDAEGEQLVNSTGNEVTRSGNGRDRDWLRPGSHRREADAAPGFSGGAVGLRRAAIDDVGAFDDRFFMYYEDTDLSWRLRRAGWGIWYAPDAIVRHAHAASSDSASDFFLFHNERNRLYFALKQAPWGVVVRAAGRTLASAIIALGRGRRSVAGRKFRALGAALRSAPALLRERRRIDRAAVVPRAVLAGELVGP